MRQRYGFHYCFQVYLYVFRLFHSLNMHCRVFCNECKMIQIEKRKKKQIHFVLLVFIQGKNINFRLLVFFFFCLEINDLHPIVFNNHSRTSYDEQQSNIKQCAFDMKSNYKVEFDMKILQLKFQLFFCFEREYKMFRSVQ